MEKQKRCPLCGSVEHRFNSLYEAMSYDPTVQAGMTYFLKSGGCVSYEEALTMMVLH